MDDDEKRGIAMEVWSSRLALFWAAATALAAITLPPTYRNAVFAVALIAGIIVAASWALVRIYDASDRRRADLAREYLREHMPRRGAGGRFLPGRKR